MSFVYLSTPYFPDPTAGRPIYNGSIYIGEPDTDPKISENQKPVTLVLEDETVVPIAQPVHTGAGGVPMYNNMAAKIVVDGAHSLKLLNSLGGQVYYTANNVQVVAIGMDYETMDMLYNRYYNLVTDEYTAADANLQEQLTGEVPLEASVFSPISWHDQVIETSVSIPDNKNGWSFGPTIILAEGVTVTIGDSSFWTIANGTSFQLMDFEYDGGIL